MQLINKVMLPMFGRVTLERNRKYGKLTAGLESKHIGMGTSETWHGTPDFRIGCVCMLSTGVADEYNFDDAGTSKSYVEHCSPYSTPSVSSPSSPTLSLTDLEGKKIQNFDRDQLVATCVLSSFINNNVNKRVRTPAILINGKVFIVCLYDCSKMSFCYRTLLSM